MKTQQFHTILAVDHFNFTKKNFRLFFSFQDSFVSAQDTIADLRDFEDLNEIVGETDAKEALYLEALEHLEKDSIPYRSIRTEFVGCVNDTEYLAKLHCLRLAFKFIMSNTDDRNW